MTIILHHLENSRSQRIIWLLEELGLPYEIKRYERHPKTQKAPDSLKAIHPLGKSPMIEDDGEVIIETAAIVEYLVEKAGGQLGAPADTKGARLYTQYLHFAEGSMMPPLYGLLVVGRLGLLGLPARKPVDGHRPAGLAGNRIGGPRLFCRGPADRRRYHDELPARSLPVARRAR